MVTPVTVQSKLNYLIESLVSPPDSDPNAATALDLLQKIYNVIKPPSLEFKATTTVGTTAVKLIDTAVNMRKKFYIYNGSTSYDLFIDFTNGSPSSLSSSNNYIRIPTTSIYVDDIYEQRAVWGIRSTASTFPVIVRYWE